MTHQHVWASYQDLNGITRAACTHTGCGHRPPPEDPIRWLLDDETDEQSNHDRPDHTPTHQATPGPGPTTPRSPRETRTAQTTGDPRDEDHEQHEGHSAERDTAKNDDGGGSWGELLFT